MAYFHWQYQQPPGQSNGLQHCSRFHSTPSHVTCSALQHLSMPSNFSPSHCPAMPAPQQSPRYEGTTLWQKGGLCFPLSDRYPDMR